MTGTGHTAAPSDVSAVLERYFRQRQRPGVASVYLFGSHAAARAHRESDVDVGVLLDRRSYPTPEERFEARVELSAALAAALSGPIADIVVLNDAPPLFGRHVVYTGRRVFCSDPEADRAFVRDVQLRAADLEPFLRRMCRIKLAAVER